MLLTSIYYDPVVIFLGEMHLASKRMLPASRKTLNKENSTLHYR